MVEMSRAQMAALGLLNSLLNSVLFMLETLASLDQAREHYLHGMDLQERK